MVNGDFSSLLGTQIGTDPAYWIGQRFIRITSLWIAFRALLVASTCNGANPVYTRSPFPNNHIPIDRLDPAALKIASLFPAPNQPITPGNYPQNDYYR